MMFRSPKLLVALAVSFPFVVQANVNCTGVPERLYAGAHGPNSAGSKFWIVMPGWEQYLIGHVTDDMAKARFGLAQVALASGKQISMSFYYHSDCATARADKATPSAFSILE